MWGIITRCNSKEEMDNRTAEVDTNAANNHLIRNL